MKKLICSPLAGLALLLSVQMQTASLGAHSALSWDQAVKAVIEGKCAFTSMGDWTYGELVKAKLKDNEDFGWVSHPGTDGAFIIVSDGFTLAKGAPHKQDCVAWLKSCGSKETQEAFNPLKGSIPTRTDIDKSKFGPYHNWSMESFAKDKLLPSLAPIKSTGSPRNLI